MFLVSGNMVLGFTCSSENQKFVPSFSYFVHVLKSKFLKTCPNGFDCQRPKKDLINKIDF